MGRQTRMFVFPYPEYSNWSLLLSMNPFFPILYQLPLIVMASILIMMLRPRIVIGNGLVSTIPAMLLKGLIGCKTVISQRGDIAYYTGRRLRYLLSLIIRKRVDLAFVNSEGSREDFSLVCPQEKIVVNEHSADQIFFSEASKDRAKRLFGFEDRFVIGYVGNLDRDKLCHWLLPLSKRLYNYKDILIAFVGQGELSKEIKKWSSASDVIRYMGHIQDRGTLHLFYVACDIVWAPIEETYLGRPAVEALASGTPVLAPDMPGVYGKQMAGVRISRRLPKTVGWVVPTGDLESMVRIVLNAREEPHVLKSMAKDCRAFAMERYGPGNIDKAIRELLKLQTLA